MAGAAFRRREAPDLPPARGAGVPRLEVLTPLTALDDVLLDFLRFLTRRDLSPKTNEIYAWALNDLFMLAMTAGIADVRGLTRDILERWQDRMIERRLAARSRALAVVAARQFIKWAAKRDIVSIRLEDALVTPRVPDPEPRPLPDEHLELVKAYLFTVRPKMTLAQWRDRAIFAVLLASGFRVSECLALPRVGYQGAYVRQKGGRKKQLLLPDEVVRMVEDYVSRRRDDSPDLWISLRSNAPLRRLEASGVRQIWRRVAAELGIPYFTTHRIRHTTATKLGEAGVPDRVIQKVMGHKTLAMLPNYTEIRAAQRQQAVDVMSQALTVSRPAPSVRKRTRRASWARLSR